MGLDIARFGDDKTVIIVREGIRVLHIEELRKSDLVNTTGRVITVAKEFKVKHIIVDEVGIGAGVLDTLKKDRTYLTTGLNGGARADDAEKYGNLRAQIFDGLRQRFADGDISIPNDPELISQVAALTYRYNARGQLLLESKDVIKGHGMQSPDKADALAYAFAEHQATKHARESRYTTQKPSPDSSESNAATKNTAINNKSPPSLREGGRERSEQGDARNSPPRHSRKPTSFPRTPPRQFPRTREPSEKQSTPFPTPHPKNRIISLFPNLYPNSKQSPVPAHIWYFPTVLPTFT